MGSEPGMGWHWITALAEHCECYVISEGECRPQVEQWLGRAENKSVAEHIHFYWLPIGGDDEKQNDRIRRMCWNQGDWRFYYYYRKWQKRAAACSREIVEAQGKSGNPIQILHQLNMIGFREPGYLWQVSKEKNVPLVWGPIGGMKMFPIAYASDRKQKCFNVLKNVITFLQLKYSPRVRKTIKQSSALIASIPDSYNAIRKYYGRDSIIIPETGCDISYARKDMSRSNKFTILWVGKFDYRKRLDIAISAMAVANNEHLQLVICGAGSQQQIQDAKELVSRLNLEGKVMFAGACANNEVKQRMAKADAFLFTSVNEDTSTVVMEAISAQLPVVCFDCCGMSSVVDEQVGITVPLTYPEQSVIDFAMALNTLYASPERCARLSYNCMQRAHELSWDNKAKQMLQIYQSITKN